MATVRPTCLTPAWESGCTSTTATYPQEGATSILRGAMQLPQQRFWLLMLVTLSIRHARTGAKPHSREAAVTCSPPRAVNDTAPMCTNISYH